MSYIETVFACIKKIKSDYISDMEKDVREAWWYFNMADEDLDHIFGASQSAYVIGEVDDRDIDRIQNAINHARYELEAAYYALN